jgi:LytS/YehU family sensor histidine kinase
VDQAGSGLYYIAVDGSVPGDGSATFGTALAGATPAGVKIGGDIAAGYTEGGYYICGSPSARGNFALLAFVPERLVLASLPLWLQIGLFLAAGILLTIPLLAFLSRQEMEKLRIKAYEERLSKQKAELQHLQLQINPHFYLGVLNVIYSLAGTGRIAELRSLIVSLGKYLRHIFKNAFGESSLGEELAHIENYLCIQELRYPGLIRVAIDLPDELAGLPAPLLCLHTFVENAVKYRRADAAQVQVTISGGLDLAGMEPVLVIVMRDNGPGYPAEVLAALGRGESVVDAEGQEHIGIWNLMQRLASIYGGKATLRLYNEGGAVMEMRLPVGRESDTAHRR